MNVSMEKNPSKYLHFKSAWMHQGNDWGNTNEERRETRSNVVGGHQGWAVCQEVETVPCIFRFVARCCS